MILGHDLSSDPIPMVQLPASLWKSALDGASDEIYLVDQHGIIHYANNAAVTAMGFNEAQLVGHPIADLKANLTPIEWAFCAWKSNAKERMATTTSRNGG